MKNTSQAVLQRQCVQTADGVRVNRRQRHQKSGVAQMADHTAAFLR